MGVLARLVVRYRWLILAAALLLLLPGLYGLRRIKLEYDLMSYLPATPAKKAQTILDREFRYGATAYLMVKGRKDWEVERLKGRVAAVPGVESVSWLDDVTDIAVPRAYMDRDLLRQYYRDGNTILQVAFARAGSTPETQAAIKKIKSLLGRGATLSGSVVSLVEMQELALGETPRMIAISFILIIILLLLAIPSPVVPLLFLGTLGFAVAFNLGLNGILGHKISYLTNAVVPAMQLGVTLDFCIFLWERYREERGRHGKEEAMTIAIRRTATAVMASALTTVFGFLALAGMRNGLGTDLGLTLARGVLFSLLACLTILPSLLLLADRAIFAWQHRSLLPSLSFLARFVPKAKTPLFLVFLLVFVPAYYGYRHVKVSYNLEATIPAGLPSVRAVDEMRRSFGSVDTINLVTKGIRPYELERILAKLECIRGIKEITAYHRLADPAVPACFVPEQARKLFVAGDYANSTIILADKVSSPATPRILAEANEMLAPYGDRAMLAGQAAIVNDMGAAAKSDLPRVNTISLVLIVLTLTVSFLSLSLPVALVLAVQLAIWLNQGFAFYTGGSIFYFGTVAIGAIQLGATVDYAVLLTARYREELAGCPPVPAMAKTLRACGRAILTSASTLFVATIGIYFSTSLQLVRDLVLLIARGAICTVAVVLLLFPALLLTIDRLTGLTTVRWPSGRAAKEKKEVPSCAVEP